METLIALFGLNNPLSIIYAAIGLGFVIFVHELGHFAVAKWCGVRVERFSIGFGPVIWSYIKGETEYALSLIPIGGYVKMLGQDDADPTQMTNEQVTKDPRSFMAKSVPQRMAIISAGVIMNLLTTPLFFGVALMMGLQTNPPVIGGMSPGGPAWIGDLQTGDTIETINGKEVKKFQDIMRGVIFGGEKLEITGVHADGTKFTTTVIPDTGGTRKKIGIGPCLGLRLVDTPAIPVTLKGSAASEAEPPLEGGDLIKSIDGEDLQNFASMQRYLAKHRNKEVKLTVERKEGNKEIEIEMPANKFRTLGLVMDIGQITSIRKGSPADGKLEVGDKITHFQETGKTAVEVGSKLDPLKLPEVLADAAGKTVRLKVLRQKTGGDAETIEVDLVPEDRPAWLDPPVGPDQPLALNSIGAACHVLHTVLGVVPGSPADGTVQPKDQIAAVTLTLPEGVEQDSLGAKPLTVEFSNEKRCWPYVMNLIQLCPEREVKLTVITEGKKRDVTLKPAGAEDWYFPMRGMNLELMSSFRRVSDPVQALGEGVSQANEIALEIYTVLYNLVSQDLSWKELRGPIGIVGAAVTQSDSGLAQLLHFLGYLSVNLAVLNFLPIPLLDGGHMVFLIYEGLRGKPAPERIIVAAMYVGMAFVLSMIMMVLYLDIFVHWLGFGGPK
ncbi:MAG: RIP metalloprotease RseP [Planctomycetaceae bacterium]|nr:RIP metalloprotease RseP [Planctomycetaceae bacterium]